MMNWLEKTFPNAINIPNEFIKATTTTIYMVLITALFAGILGIIIGVTLVVTDKHGVYENKYIHNLIDKTINIFRSIPFIILLSLIAPLTKFISGTTIGTTGAIVPLVFGTTPFFARQIQNALVEVDKGVIEAAIAMGSSPLEIIFRVYLTEGLPSMIRAGSVTIINLIGLTAMAGAIGAGGLGNLAIVRGYNRFQTDVTWVTVLIILALVFITQAISNYFIRKLSH